ncbi:MAG: 30S ribosomal protein S8 [Acidobacteria bacterium]|jgi:small subunit ribosomal protein S8|nr:30S ribosomal protein S8 [Acidobacteriota bacterium]
MTDPIADMLTRLRNAVRSRHARVDVPTSTLKAEIARILEREGYIHGFKMMEPAEEIGGFIRIFLKYGPRGETVITGISRVSRPGRRVYFGRNDVPKVMAGLGTSILTTSHGVMTGRDAVKAGVGGEVLCNIW